MIIYRNGKYIDTDKINQTQGIKGDPGPQGPKGKSAYELAVENGFNGTLQEWLNSLVGPQGEAGPQGNDGLIIKINVGGVEYTQQNGIITLPEYPIPITTQEIDSLFSD